MAFFSGLQNIGRQWLSGVRQNPLLQQLSGITSQLKATVSAPFQQQQQPVLRGEEIPGATKKILSGDTPGFEQRTTFQQPTGGTTRQPTLEEEQLRIFGNIQRPEDIILRQPTPEEEQMRIFGNVQRIEDVIAPGQPTAPSIQTPGPQIEAARAAQPAYQQRQEQAQATKRQLDIVQQQLAAAQQKLSTIGQATAAGFTGNTFQGAQAFLGGKRDEDEEFIETEKTGESSDVLRQQVEAIRNELIGFTGISPERQELLRKGEAAETAVKNILTSRDLGIAEARERPIATPFIRGQEAAITRRAELQTRPLLQQVSDIGRQQALQQEIERGKLQATQIRFQAAESALSKEERREKEKREEAQERQRSQQEQQQLNNLVAAVQANPGLLDSLNPTARAQVIAALQTQGADLSGFQQAGAPARTPTGGGGQTIGGVQVSDNTIAVLQGVSSLSTLTPSVKQQVESDLVQLGINQTSPQPWFKDIMEQQTQSSLLPKILQQMWDELKSRTLGTGGGGATTGGGTTGGGTTSTTGITNPWRRVGD